MPARIAWFAFALLVAGAATSARAHFLWIVTDPTSESASVRVFFSEAAEPDDPDLLDKVTAAKVWAVGHRRGEPEAIAVAKGAEALEGKLPAGGRHATVVLRHEYGVLERGDQKFLLNYYAKTYPSAMPGTWRAVEKADLAPLEIVPALDGQALALTVHWQGKPIEGSEVVVEGPGLSEPFKGTTDAKGTLRVRLDKAGLHSIRAKHAETKSGELAGKKYDSVRHYATLALNYAPTQMSPAAHPWPELPQGVTSFGGAIDGDALYVFGGHHGQAHHYSKEGQSPDFLKLDLRDPKGWEKLAAGPRRTGTAMVAHGGKLYRVGGFEATNTEKEEQSLHSRADFARFDPRTGQWEALPDLPEPRSSHDAAVIGNSLYVVGGWQLGGGSGDAKWHETAWSVDLSQPKLEWTALPKPPFQRRALALAAHAGKLYVLGGMRESGGATTEVSTYDPATKTWAAAPAISGSPMDGFGCSAFAAHDALYVTTMSGSVQRLSATGDRWEFVGQLEHPRFFHRLLPWKDGQLVVVGGASMGTGKVTALERLPTTAP